MRSAHCPVHRERRLLPSRVLASDRFWGCPGHFSYGVCPSCGTHVLDPQPEPAELAPYYSRYYSDAELASRRSAAGPNGGNGGQGVERLRAADTLRTLGKLGVQLGPGARVLDVGCGLGGFARSLRDQCGVVVRGLDSNPKCRAFADEVHGVQVDVGELREQHYPDGSFELVTAWHYLEHVYDPPAELHELARITRPDGHLLLELPCPGWLGRLFRGRWLFLQAPTHLYHFQPDALRELVERAGFETVRVTRPWVPSELAGSILMGLGLHGFAPRLLFGCARVVDKLWLALFSLLMLIDIPLTLLLALAGRSGVVRVIARRRASILEAAPQNESILP